MDFGAIGENLPIIIATIVFILLQFILRKPKPAVMQQDIVQSLLSEVKLNKALVETFHLRQKPKKLELVSWQRNRTKIDFLQQSLQSALSETLAMAEDFNEQVEVTKKQKSVSYLSSINADKLKEPLAKSQQGLEEWLLANAGTIEPSTKYPGLLDGLFGGRR